MTSAVDALAPDATAIAAALRRIRDPVRHTPLERSHALSNRHRRDIHVKLECWQPTRSFKVRGAFNAIRSLDAAARARGLVTASAGNHGQAVALAAADIGARALIFAPHDAPDAKKRRIRALGATLDDTSRDYDEAEARARSYAAEHGATLVHAFSDPDVVAGQGTVGLEILADLPMVRTIVVPVGGGGLIAGIGIAVRARSPATRIVGVQSVETRVMHDSLAAGRVLELPVTPTLADGLAGGIDAASLARVQRVVDAIVLVEEAAIARAIRTLFEDDGIVAEGSAAAAIAALDRLQDLDDGPVVAVITGGNIDSARLTRILQDR